MQDLFKLALSQSPCSHYRDDYQPSKTAFRAKTPISFSDPSLLLPSRPRQQSCYHRLYRERLSSSPLAHNLKRSLMTARRRRRSPLSSLVLSSVLLSPIIHISFQRHFDFPRLPRIICGNVNAMIAFTFASLQTPAICTNRCEPDIFTGP